MIKKRVLLVDDEKNFTALLKLNLESAGLYDVRIENNSLNAIHSAIEFHPQVILLDIIMPYKEGPDIANELKQTESCRTIPIIFLTATVTRQEVEEYNGQIGGHQFVAKPSTLYDLINTIEKSFIYN